MRTGIASIRWVRPVLMLWCTDSPLRRVTATRCSSAGISSRSTASAAATCSVVGMVSLLLWPAFTWSLGFTGWPSARLASVATTSLAFMLVLVPEPVWNTSIGNCAMKSPSAAWPQACAMAWASSGGSWPILPLARAAAALTISKARTKPAGMRWPLTGKFCTARWVCAPYSASAGTATSPMLSVSVRVSVM